MVRVLLVPLFLAVAAGAAVQDDAAGEQRNAAYWYRHAIERLEGLGLSAEDRRALDEWQPASGRAPSPQVRRALESLRPVFDDVSRGAQQPGSDFGLDLARGPELLMPHLGALRGIADLMSRDAAMRLQDGDPGPAAADLGALYRMAGHFRGDGTVISSLVGQSVFERVDRVTQAGLESGAFDAAASADLHKAVTTLPGRDPFGVVDALVVEKDAVVSWVQDRGADPARRNDLVNLFGAGAGAEQAMAGITLMDADALAAASDQFGRLTDRVVEALTIPDTAEARLELEAVGREVARGDHGPLALLMAPAYSKVLEKLVAAERLVAERAEALEAIATGRVKPGERPNAAAWYLRAAERLAALSPEQLRSLRSGAGIDDAASAPVLDLVRQGAAIEHCDFGVASSREEAIPGWLDGLRDAGRLLERASRRRLAAGDGPGAAATVAVAWRLSGHLGGDGRLASSAVAHASFLECADVAVGGVEDEIIPPGSRGALAEALRAIRPADPFGYREALATTRRVVGATGIVVPDDVEPSELLRLHVALRPAPAPGSATETRAALAGLLAEGDLEDRIDAARRDYRRCARAVLAR